MTVNIDETLITQHLDSLKMRMNDKFVYDNTKFAEKYTNLIDCLSLLGISVSTIKGKHKLSI